MTVIRTRPQHFGRASGVPVPGGLAELLGRRRHHSRSVYAGATGGTLDGIALWRAARRWAGQHAGGGLPAGPVGLSIADPVAFAGAFVPLLAAGATIVPLDPDQPPAALRADVAELGLTALVTDGPADVPVPLLAPAAGRARLDALPRGGGTVLLRSSGSTGPRKVIPLSEAQLLHTARAVARSHGLGPTDVGFCPLPLFHVNAEVVGLLATLVSGGRLVLAPRFSRRALAGIVAAHDISWVNAVPAIIAILGAGEPVDLGEHRLRFVRSASAPLPVAALERFEAAYRVPVVETYGMTEAASQICANPVAGPRKAGTVGRPVETDLRVVDDEGGPSPVDTVGHVQIRGPGVVPGGLPDGWLDTGDLGRLDHEGYLTLLARAGDVINRGGEKLFPRDIEEVLAGDDAVAAVAVVGRPDDVLGEVPVAYLTLRAGHDPQTVVTRLRAATDAVLPRPRRPAALVVTGALPTGPTGKVARRAVGLAATELDAGALARG